LDEAAPATEPAPEASDSVGTGFDRIEQDEPVNSASDTHNSLPQPHCEKEYVALQNSPANPDIVQSISERTHGGALPR
jgi:hypothetical protein